MAHPSVITNKYRENASTKRNLCSVRKPVTTKRCQGSWQCVTLYRTRCIKFLLHISVHSLLAYQQMYAYWTSTGLHTSCPHRNRASTVVYVWPHDGTLDVEIKQNLAMAPILVSQYARALFNALEKYTHLHSQPVPNRRVTHFHSFRCMNESAFD